MFNKPTTLELWQKHRTEFLKIYASEQNPKLLSSDLEKWFVDSNGAQYYKFSKQLALPIERLGQLKAYITFMAGGLSGEEQIKLLNSLDDIILAGLGNKDNLLKLSSLSYVMRERTKMVIHTELMYNMIAIQAIREDENPIVINNDIHLQKVKQFKEETEKGSSYFFFQSLQLTVPFDFSKITTADWTALWHESEANIQSLNQILDLILSSEKSLSKKKTSPVS